MQKSWNISVTERRVVKKVKVVRIQTLSVVSDPNRQWKIIELICRRPYDLDAQTERLIKLDFPEAFSDCTAPSERTQPHIFEHVLLAVCDRVVGSNSWEGETSEISKYHFTVRIETWATVPDAVFRAIVKLGLRYTLRVMRSRKRMNVQDVQLGIRKLRRLLHRHCCLRKERGRIDQTGQIYPAHFIQSGR